MFTNYNHFSVKHFWKFDIVLINTIINFYYYELKIKNNIKVFVNILY